MRVDNGVFIAEIGDVIYIPIFDYVVKEYKLNDIELTESHILGCEPVIDNYFLRNDRVSDRGSLNPMLDYFPLYSYFSGVLSSTPQGFFFDKEQALHYITVGKRRLE